MSAVENSGLPNGWAAVPLGDVIKLEYGKALTKKTRDETGEVAVYGSSGDVGRHNKAYIDEPCLIVGRKGNVGNIFISHQPCWPIDTVYYVIPPEGIDIKYLYYQLGQLNLARLDKSTAIPGLNRNDAYKVSFKLAPPEQQKRIVAKIEELFSHIDAGIEALKKAKQLLKQYRQSVLKAAVTGELTKEWRQANKDKLEPAAQLLEKLEIARNAWIEKEIAKDNSEAKRLKNKLKKHEYEELDSSLVPEGWESVSLTKLCLLVVDCHNKTAPYVECGIPLIRTSNIRDGVINFKEKMKFVNQETYEYWSRRCPPEPGDILFTREAPMGESAIIPENTKVCMGQRMMLIRIIHEFVDVEYLHIALMDPLFQKRVQGFKVGVGVQHLRVGDVEKAVVVLPPLVEQKEIARVAGERLVAITRLETDLDRKLVMTEKNKQSILASGFNGGIK